MKNIFNTLLLLVIKATLTFFLFSIISCNNHKSLPKKTIPGEQNVSPSYDSLREIYERIVSQYNASRILIDDLSTRNAALEGEVKKGNNEIAQLRKNINDIENRKISVCEKKNSTLTEELNKAKSINTTLKELGSVLHVSNIRIYPIHISNNGKKLRIAKKIKKLNELRMYFDVDENFIANEGVKQLYIAITAPNGKLLKNVENTTGSITTFNGTVVDYSMLKEVTLKQNEALKNVVVNCKLNNIDQKGAYKISIYNGGYIIGNETIILN